MSQLVLSSFRHKVYQANQACLKRYREAMQLFPIAGHTLAMGARARMKPSQTTHAIETRRTCQEQMRVFRRLEKALLAYLQLASRPKARAQWGQQLCKEVAAVVHLCRTATLRPEYQGLAVPFHLAPLGDALRLTPAEMQMAEGRSLTDQAIQLSDLADAMRDAHRTALQARGKRELELVSALAAELSPETLALFKDVISHGASTSRVLAAALKAQAERTHAA